MESRNGKRRDGSRLRALAALAAMLAVFAVAVPVAAGQGRDEAAAKREYERGWKALQAGEFARAHQHYVRSHELSPRPRTLFNIAVAEEKLGRVDDALRHYREFLAQAEARDRQFEGEARQRIADLERRAIGTLVVSSTPLCAEVFIDGSSTASGRTPLTLKLVSGAHRVKVVAAGAEPAERSVEVAAGRLERERFSLAVPARVIITAEPEDATIRRRGEERVMRGEYRSDVPPGAHEFVVTRDGFREETITVSVEAGQVYQRYVQLRGLGGAGSLIVRSDVAGVSVSVDGVVVGTTSLANTGEDRRPALRYRTSMGRHIVIVESPDGDAWREQLHVSPNEVVEIDIGFRSRHRRGSRWLRWGLVGLGTAAIVTGGTFGVLAIRDVSATELDNHSRGKSRAWAADGLLVAGGLALGGAWWLGRGRATRAEITRSHPGE